MQPAPIARAGAFVSWALDACHPLPLLVATVPDWLVARGQREELRLQHLGPRSSRVVTTMDAVCVGSARGCQRTARALCAGPLLLGGLWVSPAVRHAAFNVALSWGLCGLGPLQPASEAPAEGAVGGRVRPTVRNFGPVGAGIGQLTGAVFGRVAGWLPASAVPSPEVRDWTYHLLRGACLLAQGYAALAAVVALASAATVVLVLGALVGAVNGLVHGLAYMSRGVASTPQTAVELLDNVPPPPDATDDSSDDGLPLPWPESPLTPPSPSPSLRFPPPVRAKAPLPPATKTAARAAASAENASRSVAPTPPAEEPAVGRELEPDDATTPRPRRTPAGAQALVRPTQGAVPAPPPGSGTPIYGTLLRSRGSSLSSGASGDFSLGFGHNSEHFFSSIGQDNAAS